MDDLEKLLSSDSKSPDTDSNPPEIDFLDKMDELDALSEDPKEPRAASASSGGSKSYEKKVTSIKFQTVINWNCTL